MKKKDIIPLQMVENAVVQGWEVVGYSEFVNGVPKYADIEYLTERPSLNYFRNSPLTIDL